MGIVGPEDAITIAGMYAERSAYQMKQWILKCVHDIMEILFHAAGLIIDTLRTFILIVLSILGPVVFGIAVWDGLFGSMTAWFSRYISVYLWLPVSSILTALLTKIQVLMVQKELVSHRLLPHRYRGLLLCAYGGRLDYRSRWRHRLIRS